MLPPPHAAGLGAVEACEHFTPIDAAEFARLLDGLGPFEATPRLAVAVSGGADSTALAMLVDRWARERSGNVLALVVDHGLRAASAMEAALTVARLEERGIPPVLLTLRSLQAGPGVAARARAARLDILEAACAERGILHLLLGHHAADQAETIAMRGAAASGRAGLAGMAALRETRSVRVLRPLLTVPGGRLRACLAAAAMQWVEDPSNQDQAALRVRLRRAHGDPAGGGPVIAAALRAAEGDGAARRAQEIAVAAELAQRTRLFAEGFAVMTTGPISAAALAALLRVIGGRAHSAATAALLRLAADPRPATLAGVRLLPAGRLGPAGSLLFVREAAAIAAPVAAMAGAVWDGRFRVTGSIPPGATIGAAGRLDDRRAADGLPAAVRHALPALRVGGAVVAVPHLGWGTGVRLVFDPPLPAAGAAFHPAKALFATMPTAAFLASDPAAGEAR